MSELRAHMIGSTVAYDQIALIPDGDDLSNFCDVGGFKLTGIFIPANFNGGAASTLTFKVAYSDELDVQATQYGSLVQDDGTVYTVTVPAIDVADTFTYIELPVAKFAGIKYIAIQSELTQTDGNALIRLALTTI